MNDQAVAEVCPVWPGQPMTAHWGVEDPAAVSGEGAEKAFRNAFHTLEARIRLLVSLPIAKLEGIKLQRRLEEIGTVPLPSVTTVRDRRALVSRLAAIGARSVYRR